jgi:hypothetical protein
MPRRLSREDKTDADPSLQAMFRGDMAEQRRKLMQMLTAAVKGLDRLDQLVPVVQELRRCSGRSRRASAMRSRTGAARLRKSSSPMLEGAAVHTAMAAERLAEEQRDGGIVEPR